MTLQADAQDLIAEHRRLAKELADDGMEAYHDGNPYVGERLGEQAHLHSHTVVVLTALLDEINTYAGAGF